MIPLLCICIETPCTPFAEVCSEPAATSGNVAGPVRGLLVACATDVDVRLPCQVAEAGVDVHDLAIVDHLMTCEREPSGKLSGAMAAGEPATATAELLGDGLLSYCKMLLCML